MRSLLAIVAAASAVAAAAGNGAGEGDFPYDDCDPLVPTMCMYPWPNNFWLNAEGKTEFGANTFPADNSGYRINPAAGWNGQDGFSPGGPIMTHFPNVSIEMLPHFWDMASSLDPNAHSLLLDTTTGKPVAHWTELDHSSDGWEDGKAFERTLLMMPAARLDDSKTYIVAYRNLTSEVTGGRLPATPAFAALRDGSPSSDPSVNARRGEYAKLFAAVEGVPGWAGSTHSLTLAWEFTVGSTKQWTGKFVSMRDDAFARLPSGGPEAKIWSVRENPDDVTARHIEGAVLVPWYLNQDGPGMSVRLVVDEASGNPVFQDFVWVNFTMIVPLGVVNGTSITPARVVQYGHGLFGSREEVEDHYLQVEGGENKYVYIATDWMGLSNADVVDVSLMIATNMSNFLMIPDRLHQGMLNALVSMRAATTSLVNVPALTFDGVSVVDPTKTGYYGNSQGGIMGGVYMGVSTDVTRGVLGVAGAPYTLLLPRSKDFADLYIDIRLRFADTLSRFALLGLFQLLWNQMDPVGYLHSIADTPLPGTPSHRIIVHYGDGDAQVTWLGGQFLARSVGAVMFEGNQAITEGNVTLYGFPFIPDDAEQTTGNAVQGFNFAGIPTVPFINVPPTKADTHEDPRRTPQAQAATGAFLNDGVIKNFCDGPCKDLPVPQRG